ncbi:ammonium transporter [Planctobacterium marinum]|uniref:Ammonium transporter n=1 Tax=Planctobacterium marinum TaxID=1631968 RepID=A0AA48HVL7_9ALTE|nr:hypothetical protein MACH26_09010 [Planctobacterium marinum]
MDYFWLIGCAMLVFLMQAGFLCLETGKIRSKNSINVAAKNLSDLVIASVVFWLFGFGLMFGESIWGIVGGNEFLFGAQSSAWQISFFLFQLMFCGTAATILSGAVAERMSYRGYVLVTLVLCCFIYPVVGHWAWASAFNGNNTGWLQALGFVDFAGSTIVHSVGGWIALSAVIIIGPRIGRFDKDKRIPVGNNLPFSVLGTILIWLGWFGFNGGSTLVFNESVPKVLLNTCLAAAWGGVAATCIFVIRHKFVDVTYILNGVIAGLVSITASAHAVTAPQAALIGIVGGLVLYQGCMVMERLKLDDALSVVPAHLFAGIWGTLAVALFGDASILATGLGFWQQLSVQLLGVVSIGIFCLTVSYLLLRLINHFVPLRVTAEQEYLGMNITEHRASTELIDLLTDMQGQEREGRFDESVSEEPFTEVGQIAKQYNRVINRVQEEMSKRDEAIHSFRSSEKRKSAILDASMDCIITIDRYGNIIEFNPAAERTFGQTKSQVAGLSFVSSFVTSEAQQGFLDSIEHQFSQPEGLLLNRRNRIVLRRISDDTFPAEITITGAAFGGSNEREFTLHIRDITRQKRMQDKLQNLAYCDPLTGLYNRTFLLDSLQRQLEIQPQDCTDIALFFLDLDRFKQVNDTLGHKAGDQLLQEVASRLNQVTRDSDIIARWGGDEFVVMMTGIEDKGHVTQIANKMLHIMRQPVLIQNRQLKVLTSVGVALQDSHQNSAESLIQHADIAMYHAKEAGRDNFKVFRPEMAEQASETFFYAQALRGALNQAQQFFIVWQPKVNARQEFIGCEALVRWQLPDHGVVSPAIFIPIAEQQDMIIELEEIVFHKIFQQLAHWRAQNRAVLPVAINVSGKHLISGRLLPLLQSLMEKFAIPGEWLEIEVTEGVFLTDTERCIAVLKAIKQLQIKVAIDDFGTGYSSLSYLKNLPLDVLKIDRSFVDGCGEQNESDKICSTILKLAESLSLSTIAEGVEIAQQFEFLKNKGCTGFQGYYFYKPMSAEQLAQLMDCQKKSA